MNVRLRADVTIMADEESQTVALYRGGRVQRFVSPAGLSRELIVRLRKGGVAADEAPEFCEQLRTLGCLEDARADALPASRHSDQLEYYALFRKDVETVPQVLAAATVAIIGLGGIGSELLRHLISAGVGRLVCIDDDVVELSNLNRQFLYDIHDVGAPKVDRAAAFVRQASPSTEVMTARAFIDSTAALNDALDGTGETFIACCADEPIGDVELAVIGRCRETSAPAGFAAMHLTRGYWSLISSERAALSNAAAFFTEVARQRDDATPFSGGSASFANSCIAALFAEDVIRHLAGLEEPRAMDRLVEFDLRSLTSRVLVDFREALK